MTSPDKDKSINTALIAGIFVILAAIITGGFLVVNTLCEKEKIFFCTKPEQENTNQVPNSLIGVWKGTTKSDNLDAIEVNVTITNTCSTGEICGSFNIPAIPCSGTFTLIDIRENNTFLFLASNFQGACASGAEDYLQLLSDDTVLFTSRHPDYGENTGLLYRVEQ